MLLKKISLSGRSYLIDRKQMTKVNDSKSGKLNNEFRTPQG